jgi:hypothetical protein
MCNSGNRRCVCLNGVWKTIMPSDGITCQPFKIIFSKEMRRDNIHRTTDTEKRLLTLDRTYGCVTFFFFFLTFFPPRTSSESSSIIVHARFRAHFYIYRLSIVYTRTQQIETRRSAVGLRRNNCNTINREGLRPSIFMTRIYVAIKNTRAVLRYPFDRLHVQNVQRLK